MKFSFERYRGAAAKTLKETVAAVEMPDPGRVRFRLKRAWPDSATFYLSATGASWIVPKKYVEKVGDDGFKKAPIGAGPYKFVSFTPGVERVLEAFDQYRRKVPNVAGGGTYAYGSYGDIDGFFREQATWRSPALASSLATRSPPRSRR